MKIPGLIDLQVNGYKGVDFSSPELTAEDFAGACRQLFQAGTTAFLPTLITSPVEVYERNLPIITGVMETDEFTGRLPGIHLEGPFISARQGARGAHNRDYIRKPDVELFRRMVEWAGNRVRIVTIAAELEGAEELAECATRMQITVALGHQMATGADLKRLLNAGASALTHLGNGMPKNLPRHKNPIWAGLAEDGLMATIITDGHHLPADVIKTFIRAKTPNRCIVISDASPLAGLPAGHYDSLGNHIILEDNGRVYSPDNGYLAGSSATILQCMNYLASLELLTFDELMAVGFYNPLELIELDAGAVRDGVKILYDEDSGLFSTAD